MAYNCVYYKIIYAVPILFFSDIYVGVSENNNIMYRLYKG